jgi:hypothetical protein
MSAIQSFQDQNPNGTVLWLFGFSVRDMAMSQIINAHSLINDLEAGRDLDRGMTKQDEMIPVHKLAEGLDR